MIVSIIAAAAENDVIGKDNDLPWHLPKEFQHFKDTTKGHHVIMGRKTFESFPQPLPERPNIVITRQKYYHRQGCEVVNSLEDALNIARENGEEEAFVIGGEQIYRMALPHTDRMYLTRVHTEVDGDTYFPKFDESEWKVTDQQTVKADAENKYDYTIYVYERRT
jgi:dihydrofolate reductase